MANRGVDSSVETLSVPMNEKREDSYGPGNRDDSRRPEKQEDGSGPENEEDRSRPEKQEDSTGPEPSERTESPIPADLPDHDHVPDGGLVAWLQVAGAFILFFNSWGLVNTFGVFQTYYESDILSDSTSNAISWIGSLQSFLLLGGGMISGPLFDGGWFKVTIAVGTFLISFGFMMASLASAYWQVLLSQGVCIGLGAGCMVVPALSILPQYFQKKRAVTTGIAVCGSSIGGVIYPIMFQNLIDQIGYGWTTRILGFMALGTCSFSVAVMRVRTASRKVRSPFDPTSFKEPPFVLYCVAMFFSNFGFFPPIFYLQTYALNHGLTNRDVALNLVAILNAASALGRLTPSLVVPHYGPINTMATVTAMAAIVAFSWIAVHTGAGNIVFAVMYGFTSGGIVSLPAVVLASITDDLRFLGSRLGTSYVFSAVAALCGPPIAGAILDSSDGKYLGVQLLSGFLLLAAATFHTATRFAKAGPKLLAKV